MNLSSAIPKKNIVNKVNAYQARQLKHDRTYHREIWNLGVVRGMNHIALHLIKYLSPLYSLPVSDKSNRKSLIDAFIMVVSAGNLLNLSLGRFLETCSYYPEERWDEDFIGRYIRLLSDIAKACEATDHQEDYPIRDVWNRSFQCFFILLLMEAEKRNIDIIKEASNRLVEVENNHGLNEIFREISW